MIEESILTRDCTSFGLDDCIRVLIETHEKKNKIVLEAVAECLH